MIDADERVPSAPTINTRRVVATAISATPVALAAFGLVAKFELHRRRRKRSKAADRKARTKRDDDGLPVHSFRSLLGDLATVTRNTMAMVGSPDASFVVYPQVTLARAFELLGVFVKL